MEPEVMMRHRGENPSHFVFIRVYSFIRQGVYCDYSFIWKDVYCDHSFIWQGVYCDHIFASYK